MSMLALIEVHLNDLLPGLLGIKFTTADSERVSATLKIKTGDLHGG